MVGAGREADIFEGVCDAAAAFGGREALNEERVLDVFSAVKTGIRLKVWKTKPIFSRRRVEVREALRRDVSVPAMRMRPLVGLSMQPIRFSRVDLPLPLGPEIARNSPASMWRLTLSRAMTALWSRGNLRRDLINADKGVGWSHRGLPFRSGVLL